MLAQFIALFILFLIAVLPLVLWHHQKPRGQYSIIFKKLLLTKTKYYLLGIIIGFFLGSLIFNILNHFDINDFNKLIG